MGNDPRCMIGWENPVKTIFGAMMMGSAIGSVVLMLIVMCNMHTSALRKRIFVEELSSVAQGKDLFDQDHNSSHLTMYPDILKLKTIIVVKQKFAKLPFVY